MNHICRATALALFLATTAALLADDPPRKDDTPAKKDEAAKTPAEKFAAAKKARVEAEQAVRKVATELQKKGERPSLENKELNDAVQASNKARQEVVKAAEALAKAEPTSAAGFEAITTVIDVNGGATPAIFSLLAEHHAMSPKIGPVLSRFLARGELNKEMEAFLTKVMEKNPDKNIQGQATFTLAGLLMPTRSADAEKLLAKVVSDYKDVKYGRSTLGERAEAYLFEARHLQIGKLVPDIEGEDMEGKNFKLSDYRGKVVLLDFWGHW